MRERDCWRVVLARQAGLLGSCVIAVGSLGVPAAVAGFADDNVTATSSFGAAPDWVAPEVQSAVIAKTTGYLTASIRQGGTYYVYASVIDTGSPASGVAAETANVSAITAAGSAVTLVAGSYSAGGATFTHRSAALTAATPLSAGARSYSIASTDAAGNNRNQGGYTVTVDNTAPVASSIQTTNTVGGTQGRAELGDTITFTYSEQVDPASILGSWTGASTTVVVRLIDGGCVLNLLIEVCNDDLLAVYDTANSSQLPFGSVDLNRGDYHGTALGTANPLIFGATGTRSTMVQSGQAITVTLGTPSTTASTASGTAAMVWSPSASAYDAAGNAASTATVTESGSADKDF
jgi:hypothetical protein